jgi:class 3 adenylate cyclase
MAAEVGTAFRLTPLGTRPLRGFAEAVPVFAVQPANRDLAILPAAK